MMMNNDGFIPFLFEMKMIYYSITESEQIKEIGSSMVKEVIVNMKKTESSSGLVGDSIHACTQIKKYILVKM